MPALLDHAGNHGTQRHFEENYHGGKWSGHARYVTMFCGLFETVAICVPDGVVYEASETTIVRTLHSVLLEGNLVCHSWELLILMVYLRLQSAVKEAFPSSSQEGSKLSSEE